MKKIEIDKNDLYQKYVIEKLSQEKVAQYFGVSSDTIRNRIKEYNIPIHRQGSWCKNTPIILSEKEKEIITGALLGDGCLTKNGRINDNAQFTYISKSKEHVEFVCKNLMRFCSKKELKEEQVYDKRTEKYYYHTQYRSQLNETFTKMYEEWYPNGKKIIPKNIKLTPLTCLIWYLGDGSLTKQHSEYIYLCTDSFNKDDLETIILPQMERFEPILIAHGKNQYRIRIPKKHVKDFLNYIGPCPVKDYQHKWDYKEYTKKPICNDLETIHKIIVAYNNGSSPGTIAKYFNIDRNTVIYNLIKNNINPNLNRFSKKEVAFCEE